MFKNARKDLKEFKTASIHLLKAEFFALRKVYNYTIYCPRRDFAQRRNPKRHPSNSRVY